MATKEIAQLVLEGQGVEHQHVEAFFNACPPISAEFMLGDWRGAFAQTGSPLSGNPYNWAGKTFHTVDKVDPMVCLDDKGNRFPNPRWGAARVREMKWNGVVSAAMIYNERPIIDYMRYVDDRTVVGVMESLDHPVAPKDQLYFVLERI